MMVWMIIISGVFAGIIICVICASYVYVNSPEYKWEDKMLDLAHNTNNTDTLKQIYVEAINHGADPSCSSAWSCDRISDLYAFAKAKYDALK